MLYTLGQLSAEFPEVSDMLAVRLQEADLRMPTRPPAKSSITAAPRAGSGNATGKLSARQSSGKSLNAGGSTELSKGSVPRSIDLRL